MDMHLQNIRQEEAVAIADTISATVYDPATTATTSTADIADVFLRLYATLSTVESPEDRRRAINAVLVLLGDVPPILPVRSRR